MYIGTIKIYNLIILCTNIEIYSTYKRKLFILILYSYIIYIL